MMLRQGLALLVSLAVAACSAGVRQPERAPRAATPSASTIASVRPSRWLLHAFQSLVADSKRSVGRTYTASYVGPERIEKSIQLPPAFEPGWSPDGHWLALCGPAPSSDAERDVHQLLAIRFDAEHTSDPVPLGECSSFAWAPVGQRLLIQNGTAWRLVDFSAEPPRQTLIAEELAGLVAWSPTGRRILAHSTGSARDLRVIHAAEPTPRVEALGIERASWRGCSWSPQDALACVVQEQSKLTLQIRYANPAMPTRYTLESRLWSFGWATENTLVYQLQGSGAVIALQSGTSIPLFSPGDLYGIQSQALSPRGSWLLDTVSRHVRLWNFANGVTSSTVRGLAGPLLNPHWSPNGQHALVGVQHPRSHALQTDVWLVAHATQNAQVARIATVQSGQATSSQFSPGSQWVFVTTGPDFIPLASSGSANPATATTSWTAVHVATRTNQPLPPGTGAWASDDSAFATMDPDRARLLVVRVRGAAFAEPEVVRNAESPVPSLLWQPGP